jgi:hypothetical protein
MTTLSAWRIPVPILLLVLAACSSGGGSSSSGTAPVIVSAVFVGAGPAPAAGDDLLLFCSEDLSLVGTKLLTDADVTLSGGGTLGAVTTAPILVNARTVKVTLGSGVSFAPDTTTIAFQVGNDVVSSSLGSLAQGGSAVVIGSSDGAAPAIAALSVDGIDAALNGTGPAGGTLQAPPHSFTIDLTYSDNVGVDTAATLILASVAVGTSSGSQPAGTNLRPFLTAVSATGSAASYRVPTTMTFPTGAVTLTAYAVDLSGLSSAAATFAFTVTPYSDALRPFETTVNGAQVWYIDFSRDVESFTVSGTGSGSSVTVVAGASGRSDFEEILLVLGLLSASPIANVQGNSSSNDLVLEQYKAALLTELAGFYDGANVQFTYTQPTGTFGGNTSIAYDSLGFSRISVAGSPTSPGVLGVAIFDPNNATQNDDTVTNFQGVRLGIFLHTIVADGIAQNASTLFRQTFDPFTPSNSGTPIGGDGQDGLRLLGSLNDQRASQITAALDGFARFTAVLLAHECGHSMGLVKNGAMPTGLYGNDPVDFPGSTDGHIRNAAQFPAGAINVMSPALNYALTQHAATNFNTLNKAYLREQALYNNN